MRIIRGNGYETPKLEVVLLPKEDVVRTSVYGEDNVLPDPWGGTPGTPAGEF